MKRPELPVRMVYMPAACLTEAVGVGGFPVKGAGKSAPLIVVPAPRSAQTGQTQATDKAYFLSQGDKTWRLPTGLKVFRHKRCFATFTPNRHFETFTVARDGTGSTGLATGVADRCGCAASLLDLGISS